jgi:prepilin-type N-terminal cleavage/methylation domain-containing protein
MENRTNGFTMLEVLLSVLIISATATAFLIWQKTTWSQTRLTNRRMVACQVVEKQIEWRRMVIAQDPTAKFFAFKAITGQDTVMVDTSVSPAIKVDWKIFDTLHAPNGDSVLGAVRVKLTASWGPGKDDTMRLWTVVTKNF